MTHLPGTTVLFAGDLSARELAALRRRLDEWATTQALPADTVHAIVLSGYEALANTVEHAYRENQIGPVELSAARRADSVTVAVTDHGRWRPPSTEPTVRGRGLILIRGLCQQTDVKKTPTGTTVTMTWQLNNKD